MATKPATSMNGVTPIDDAITLSTGVMLRTKPAPLLLIEQIANAIPIPKPPIKWSADKDRDEEDPYDPDYLDAIQQRQRTIRNRCKDAMLYFGTEIVSVPDGFSGPEDTRWRGELSYFGVEIDERLPAITWLTQYAIRGANDLAVLMGSVGRKTGVMETDVAEMVGLFRGDS